MWVRHARWPRLETGVAAEWQHKLELCSTKQCMWLPFACMLIMRMHGGCPTTHAELHADESQACVNAAQWQLDAACAC